MKYNSTVSCYDKHARDYDLYQSAVVPGYQEMLDLAAEACKRYLPQNAMIIDLGCGTGNASMAVLRKMPAARVYLIDGSERMVQVAAEKISRAHPEAILGSKAANLADGDWDEGIGGQRQAGEVKGYDAIISTLVLEHLPFDLYKSALAKCFRLVKPGGWLIAAEGYSQAGSDMQEWFFEEMEVRRQSLDPDLSDFVARLRNEKETHYYTSKAEKEEWWRQAGFGQVNVLWQYLCIALMAGRRPV
ncbi:MAG TPA: class I SAM-dependent methyltransferase [Methanothrix sp.]|nr:class I SAM-dependent methyltransferase [Methanothrix sp.]